MIVSKEGIKQMPRGVVAGDRWAILEKTSPSGKTMFRCMCCGSEGPTPQKVCWTNLEDGRREPRLDCVTWQPEKFFRYKLPNEGPSHDGWALIVLSDKGYFSAVSAFGNYAFYWTHSGETDFRKFLLKAHQNWDYFASKFGHREYDGHKTYEGICTQILRQRRQGLMNAQDARREWNLITDEVDRVSTEGDFVRWQMETKLDEAWEYYSENYAANLREFCQRTLKRLSEVLEKDLRREKLL